MESADPETFAREACRRHNFAFGQFVSAGAFKSTFEVRAPDGSSLALKIIKPGVRPERTEREIAAMRRVVCPHVVSLVEVGQITLGQATCTYVVEPFLSGGTLTARCATALLEPASTLQLGQQVAVAIGALAALRLVHRDIKPDNLMFRDSGNHAVLVDLGLIRDLGAESLTRDFAAQGPGTPLFAAPEQLNNQKALIDWRTDQFALGTMLSIAALGMHPYGRDGDSPEAAIHRVAERDGPSTHFVNQSNQAGLSVLRRLVQPWPVQRINDVDEFIAAFGGT